jgi:hypothetical protein
MELMAKANVMVAAAAAGTVVVLCYYPAGVKVLN